MLSDKAYFKIRNWKNYQHYKDRQPPWIKLHADLLNDPEYFLLPAEQAKYLPLIWLCASEHSKDGTLPTISRLSFRLRLSEERTMSILAGLSHWVMQSASKPLAGCYYNATPEAETEAETETETEKTSSSNFRSTEAMQISSYLWEWIQKNNPKAKKPNLEAWVITLDRMMRIDGRTIEDIKAVIDWCQRDEFWRANILSAKKLRKQYDQLWLKMPRPESSTNLQDAYDVKRGDYERTRPDGSKLP